MEHKADLIALLSAPDPLDSLVGPYRTAHGRAWSDPDAPELEAFDAAVVLDPDWWVTPCNPGASRR